MKNEFQYRLQKCIAEKRISAAELSRISGVNKVAISNYINGVYIPKQDKCYLLAKALDVDPGWLMTGEEPTTRDRIASIFDQASQKIADQKPQTAEARIISGGIDKLPKEQRERALSMFRIMFEPQFADLFNKETVDNDDT